MPSGAVLAWSDNARHLAYLCAPTAICVVDGRSPGGFAGPVEIRFEGLKGRATRLRWSPDGSRLAGADDDHGIAIWSLAPDQNVYFDLPFAPEGASFLAGSPDGKWQSLVLTGGTLRILRMGNSIAANDLSGLETPPAAVAWSGDGSVAGIYPDGRLAIWPKAGAGRS